MHPVPATFDNRSGTIDRHAVVGRDDVGMAQQFFSDDGFNFKVQDMLGQVRSGCGDVGEMLATVATITDGDDASWVAAWRSLGDRVARIADDAAAEHPISARDAYLRAATYYAAVLDEVDGVPDGAAQLDAAFSAHRRCLDEWSKRCDPPITKVDIPFGASTMPGWFFSADRDDAASAPKRPTLVINNGSDGAVTEVVGLAAAAVSRGYHAFTFDGPGQQSMLFERQIPFRADWEAVITPVTDYLLTRSDVDADRLAIYGISQAGYWVPRALAFEHRYRAAVVDPGVVDVSSSWVGHLPKEMVEMLRTGDRTTFDQWMQFGSSTKDQQEQQVLAWRGKPYGIDDPFDLFTEVLTYRIDAELAADITTPILITAPEGEQFWPGQSQQLSDMLHCAHEMVAFTAAEGADRHCEPMARSLLEQRMFDWLDRELA